MQSVWTWGMIFGAVVMLASCSGGAGSPRVRAASSQAILNHPRISLADYHVSGRHDRATALHNIEQATDGGASRRSSYQNAPGGRVLLDTRILRALEKLADSGYSMRVSELAGGSHSRKSRHYAGISFDVDQINGVKVNPSNPYYKAFMRKCRSLGATEVMGPGDRGHYGHVHVAWPRRRGQ